ncbi:hypothetical protein AZ28_3979 [Bordetella pertussis B200]|nr:hypothetical protein AZ28_3979 [Bordetella pertussis B200]
MSRNCSALIAGAWTAAPWAAYGVSETSLSVDVGARAGDWA